MPRLALAIAFTFVSLPSVVAADSDGDIDVTPRTQQLEPGSQSEYRSVEKAENWLASETAVIVCDMWDAHHCYRAVLRENQMVPRMNSLLSHLRGRGTVIIHAPSSCVGYYQDHPARRQVLNVPKVSVPSGINSWCKSIPAEEAGKYPIDQSDGGEDDTPQEHARWTKELESQGRNPKSPWQRQHPGLTIDDQDFISDQGDEVWSILEHRKIKHVILVGVHTNMCVLGRPFGLRQLAKNGKHVVLMRDLTDSMYNPKSWPYVSHQEGTQLIISHIERHVCPTISSDQILGGKPFAFGPLR